jgi:hypothetical protein
MKIAVPTKSFDSYFSNMYEANVKTNINAIIAVSFAVAELQLAKKAAESTSMKIAVPTKSFDSYFSNMYEANVKTNITRHRICDRNIAEATLRTTKANGVSLSK